jgi:hypothetical protein
MSGRIKIPRNERDQRLAEQRINLGTDAKTPENDDRFGPLVAPGDGRLVGAFLPTLAERTFAG